MPFGCLSGAGAHRVPFGCPRGVFRVPFDCLRVHSGCSSCAFRVLSGCDFRVPSGAFRVPSGCLSGAFGCLRVPSGANVRYQTQRHMKIAVRSFVVRQMLAWYLSTIVKFPYTSASDQRSGTVLKRFISSVEKQLNNVEEEETAVRKRPASMSRANLESIATKKRRV